MAYTYRLPDGSDDTPDTEGRHTKTVNVLHSAEQAKRFAGCEQCRSIAEYEANPPAPKPAPTVYTEADLADGADALLTALRREVAAHHADHPQYHGWADDTALAIVTKRIGGGRTYVRAERGDAVLLKPGQHDGLISIWCPRIASHVGTRPSDVRVQP